MAFAIVMLLGPGEHDQQHRHVVVRRGQLLQEVEHAPWAHGFYALLREFECAHPQLPRLGRSLRPQDDAIRLGQDPSMNFAPAVFSAIERNNRGAPPRLVQEFFGMFGPNGPLPLHLTEFARERMLHHRDPSFARFIDLLHHRPLTLFYRSWAQAQPAASFDRPSSDRFSTYVGALVGMGSPALRQRDEAGDHAENAAHAGVHGGSPARTEAHARPGWAERKTPRGSRGVSFQGCDESAFVLPAPDARRGETGVGPDRKSDCG